MIEESWCRHLLSLPENGALTKRWKSGYWQGRSEDLDLGEIDGEFQVFEAVFEEDEVDIDGDDGKFNWLVESEVSEIG